MGILNVLRCYLFEDPYPYLAKTVRAREGNTLRIDKYGVDKEGYYFWEPDPLFKVVRLTRDQLDPSKRIGELRGWRPIRASRVAEEVRKALGGEDCHRDYHGIVYATNPLACI